MKKFIDPRIQALMEQSAKGFYQAANSSKKESEIKKEVEAHLTKLHKECRNDKF